jgi:hypothetical protein
MVTLLVDFNMREPDGRLPALLPPGKARSLRLGDAVMVSDGEGLKCLAVVAEMSPSGAFAMVGDLMEV